MLVFTSAGNEGRAAHQRDAYDLRVVPGMLVVGATDLKNPDDPGDDVQAPFSTGGPGYTTFSAVGVDLPIGPGGEQRDGTSYAAPIAASIAALMTEANRRLTPDDIEAILTSPQVARPLAGDRGGAGNIDPVAAVRLAKSWPQRPA